MGGRGLTAEKIEREKRGGGVEGGRKKGGEERREQYIINFCSSKSLYGPFLNIRLISSPFRLYTCTRSGVP